MKYFSLIFITTLITSCGSMTPVSKSSEELTIIRDECMKHMKNKLLARKKCFPLLSHREIYMVVDEINDDFGGLKIIGKVGSNHMVYCKPGKKTAKKIIANPASIMIGDTYKVKGIFTEFNGMNILSFYTLESCKLSKWNPEKK